MSLSNDKIDAAVDRCLAAWPSPERDNAEWDEMTDRITSRISDPATTKADPECFEPPLPAQSGEGSMAIAPSQSEIAKPVEEDRPRRSSLKEIAQRISTLPAAAGSAPASARAQPPASPLARPSEARPPVTRPVEAKSSDSGMVDLQAVRESAMPLPEGAVKPGGAGLFDDEGDEAPERGPAAAPRPAGRVSVKPAAKKKSSTTPIVVGVGFAIAALAAAVMLVNKQNLAVPPDKTISHAPAIAAVASAATTTMEPQAAPAESASSASSESLAAPLGAVARADDLKAMGPPESHGGKEAVAETPAPRSASANDKDTPRDKTATGSATQGESGLGAAMATAVASIPGKAAEPPPAASSPGAAGDLPDSPPQGAVSGALGAVMGSARACVAGMDEPSHAQVVFGSDGRVTNVSVSGPAAGKAASGCITNALKRARVSPFRRPSFTVGVTVRP